jgi:hypothetical protein
LLQGFPSQVIALDLIYFVDKFSGLPRIVFVDAFQYKKDLNALPKIAAPAELVSVLRKSGTKTYRKICGLWLD